MTRAAMNSPNTHDPATHSRNPARPRLKSTCLRVSNALFLDQGIAGFPHIAQENIDRLAFVRDFGEAFRQLGETVRNGPGRIGGGQDAGSGIEVRERPEAMSSNATSRSSSSSLETRCSFPRRAPWRRCPRRTLR